MSNKLNTDRIIGLSAMLISLLTLIIFIYQTSIIRKQSRLSVTPRLSFSLINNSFENDSFVVFENMLTNKGLGPAIIEAIYIIHKDEKYELHMDALFDQLYPDIYKYGKLTQSYKLTKGTTLRPGEEVKLYTFRAKARLMPSLMEYIDVDSDEDPFNIEVIYSSIYGEQWKTDNNRDDHPLKIK